MHGNPTAPNTTQAAYPLPIDVLQGIGRGILASIDPSTELYRSSPPEAQILTLLRFSLQPLLDGGALELRSREHLVLPTSPATEVEADLYFRATGTGAIGVVEIDGWQWHRRTAEEHAAEMRRDRMLRRHVENVQRYAAREVMLNPWAVLLDILDSIQSAWTGFELEIPAGMRTLAEVCAHGASAEGAVEPEEEDGDASRAPLVMLDHLRRLAAELPPPGPTEDPALQALRRDYPRAYTTWQESEEQALREAFRAWIDVDDIAQVLGRSPGAVWCQVRRMALVAG